MIAEQAIERLKDFRTREKRRALPDDFNVYVEHQYNIDALDAAIEALSKQCASSEQADHIADFDKMVDLKKRTATERLIIAKSLIDSVIADSDNDQFREVKKKADSEANCSDEWWKNYIRPRMRRDDVHDINVGNTEFKPGDKFILELGAERKMFKEFEIAGTDLYVKTDLLEKLTRYEPISLESAIDYLHEIGWLQEHDRVLTEHSQLEKIPYKKPEIIHCKDCKHGKYDIFDRGMWCELHPSLDVTENDYCSRAERRNDG